MIDFGTEVVKSILSFSDVQGQMLSESYHFKTGRTLIGLFCRADNVFGVMKTN
jgi:hypothetical protein